MIYKIKYYPHYYQQRPAPIPFKIINIFILNILRTNLKEARNKYILSLSIWFVY